MEKLTEVLGEYGAYVWPAYLVAAAGMAIIAAASVGALKKARARMTQLQGTDEA